MADEQISDPAADLVAYEAQQAEVGRLLLEDPDNEELQAIYADLTDVIQLTRELAEAQTVEADVAAAGAAAAPSPAAGEQHGQLAGPAEATPAAAAQPTAAGGTLLPPQVAEQIRHAQQRAALGGQGPAAWAVGAKCKAVYSGDGNWYNAVVDSVTADGNSFVVVFDGYDTTEAVGKDAIQLRAEEEGGYKGVAAPKRRRVDESAVVEEMPKWLEVKPTDDEKTKQKKRKLAKAYKSKARFARLDQQQKEKADAWKRFLAGKGKKTKK
ncbi:hypothetical protein ABPG75_000033 [Micractinium tetrahymenae]